MEHLKAMRKARNLSQKAVADYLGITRQAYCHYENGNREPDNEILLKLGEFFQVTVDTLLRGPDAHSSQADPLTEPQLKLALFGTADIPDELLSQVRTYAAFVLYLNRSKSGCLPPPTEQKTSNSE